MNKTADASISQNCLFFDPEDQREDFQIFEAFEAHAPDLRYPASGYPERHPPKEHDIIEMTDQSLPFGCADDFPAFEDHFKFGSEETPLTAQPKVAMINLGETLETLDPISLASAHQNGASKNQAVGGLGNPGESRWICSETALDDSSSEKLVINENEPSSDMPPLEIEPKVLLAPEVSNAFPRHSVDTKAGRNDEFQLTSDGFAIAWAHGTKLSGNQTNDCRAGVGVFFNDKSPA